MLITDYLEDEIAQLNLHLAVDFSSTRSFLHTTREKIDVILLDLSLPDMEGQSLLEEVMQLSGDIPIIVLTGYTNLDFAKKSLALGASDYLLKDDLSGTFLFKSIIYSIERNEYLLQVKESKRRYSDLFQLSPIPMWLYDVESLRFLDVNEAAVHHYGYSKAEFAEMTIEDIRPASELPRLHEAVQISKEMESQYFEGEFIHCKKDGEMIMVEMRSNVTYVEGRKAEIVLANDVTEKHKIQQRLHTNTYLVETRERKRISSAIHDGLQQMLLAAYMRFENIKTQIDFTGKSRIAERFNEAVDLLSEGMSQARSLAHELVPIEVEEDGLSSAVDQLLSNHRINDLQIDFEENLEDMRLPIDLEVLLFRLVQEGMNNIVKHAAASEVLIRLKKEHGFIELCIRDNGRGFDVTKISNSSFGISSMKSRVKDAAGTLQINAQINNGTQINVRIPLKE